MGKHKKDNKDKKEKKNKKKYERVSIDSNIIFENLQSLLTIFDENHIAIDEIVIHITNEDTGKSKKIHLFKDFFKFCKKLAKKNNLTEKEYYERLAIEQKEYESTNENIIDEDEYIGE